MPVLVVAAVFAVGGAIGVGFCDGVFAGGVEGGAGEVEAVGVVAGVEDLGFELGEDA